MITTLENACCDLQVLIQFITANEHLLPDPISLHTEISAYSKKMLLLGKVFLYVEDETVLGVCMGYMNDESSHVGHIQLLLVQGNSQNRGIGRQLVLRFLQEAKSIGMVEVELVCDSVNRKAMSFYSSIGFRKADRPHPNPNKNFLTISL